MYIVCDWNIAKEYETWNYTKYNLSSEFVFLFFLSDREQIDNLSQDNSVGVVWRYYNIGICLLATVILAPYIL